jgi:hypothetical protein
MERDQDAEYIFVCPLCEEFLEVNASMRDSLIKRGCVICGTTVTAEAFSKNSPAESF